MLKLNCFYLGPFPIPPPTPQTETNKQAGTKT